MKTLREFIEDDTLTTDKIIQSFIDIYKAALEPLDALSMSESEGAANTTGGVAAVDAQPFKTGKIAGCDYVEVDFDTYNKCKFGKQHYARWDKYITDEPLRNFVKKQFATSKTLMVVNKDTTAATYLRR